MKKKIIKSRWLNAYVVWFDNLSGVGVVSIPSLGQRFKLHYSAALYEYMGSKRKEDRFDFIQFNQLDLVQVKIHYDYSFIQVSCIRRKNWISYENLISDMLIRFLGDDSAFIDTEGHHFVLNNLISIVEKIANLTVKGGQNDLLYNT